MMYKEHSHISEKIIELLDLYLKSTLTWNNDMENLSSNAMIQLLVTDSKHAINFIILLEDEFEIEIDDDDISLEFFNSIASVSNAVEKALIIRNTP